MEKYNVICYRLKKGTKPIDVLQELERLIQKYNVFYSECLFNLRICIREYEFEGKKRSNRDKNAILTILKRYPKLIDFFKHEKEVHEDDNISEYLTIRNFSESDFSAIGKIEYALIKEITEKAPRLYGVNDVEIIINGIVLDSHNGLPCGIRLSESGVDSPVGNYISSSRSKYGDESHSYIYFSIDDENLDAMRKLFFEFAETMPGKYEGTEYHS